MAFIRWKKNRFGIRQAYLVHAYRDNHGRPRQKTLAYLGSSGELDPQRIPELEIRYQDLAVPWDSVQSSPTPISPTNINVLSDREILLRLRELRRAHNLNINRMVTLLQNKGQDISRKQYMQLERRLPTIVSPELSHALRQIL